MINIPKRLNKEFDLEKKEDLDNKSNLSDTQKRKYKTKLSQRQVTIRQVRKRTIRDENYNINNIEEKKEEEEENLSGFEYDVELDNQYLIESDDDIDEEKIEADKSQLMEYDKFYKEQFFKNDVKWF